MKASEFIAKLQAIVAEYGDLELVTHDPEFDVWYTQGSPDVITNGDERFPSADEVSFSLGEEHDSYIWI